jgi:Ethanolamine utilization protein EutJ (predicted chaperonin)
VESGAGFECLPDLLNVIDLGGGNAGIIVSEHGDDSVSLSLVEYRDGMHLGHIRTLQSIGSGE